VSEQRYRAFDDGPDPLAPPFDVAEAVDQIGDRILSGEGTTQALRQVLRDGTHGRGLDSLLSDVRRRQRELRTRGTLDGTLQQVEELLDRAIEQERAALFPDPSDEARFREAMLDALPSSTAIAVRELNDYDWHSPDARDTFEQIRSLLRGEVLEQQFAGLREALEDGAVPGSSQPDPAAMGRVKDMLSDLNALVAKRLVGQDTPEDFAGFMAQHGELFPDNPRTLDELLEGLARRAAALDRLMRSLPPDQADELASLMQQALADDLDLAAQLAQLGDGLRAARPDLFRRGRSDMKGEEGLGLSAATEALGELADLEALAEQLSQSYAGASLDDIDEELVRRSLGRQAADDVEMLRRTQRQLVEQGFLVSSDGRLELSPKAVRRLGLTALRRVFADLDALRHGPHDVHDAGAAGEASGASRPWEFGDEQPIDVVRTLTNAVRRGAPVRLRPEDFEVVDTERRAAAAVCLLVDTSWSMVINDTWGEAKQTALALHTLVTTMFPQDAMQVIAFSDYARNIAEHELATMDFADVQGTNLQHALLLAGHFLDRHRGCDPVVLVITDGEPTARLLRDGTAEFAWPPERETIAETVAQVDAMTRRGAVINIFQLGDDPRLAEFVTEIARRNKGRVFNPQHGRLGEYVVSDFLHQRRHLTPR